MSNDASHEPLLNGAAQLPDRQPVSRRTLFSVLAASCIMCFCFQFYDVAFTTVFPETLEGQLCRDLHDNVTDPLADPRCKGDAVQSELALLINIEMSLETVPPLLCGAAYSVLADVHGRKPILVLVMGGKVLYGLANIAICWFYEYLPTKLLWAAPSMYFLGGGDKVGAGIMTTMLTDILPESQITASFFALSSAFTLASLLGAYFATAVLRHGHYFALFSILSVQIVNFILALLIPETLNTRHRPSRNCPSPGPKPNDKLSARIKVLCTKLAASLKCVFGGSNKRLTLLLLCVFLNGIGKDAVNNIRKQYAVKRYGLSWADAGLIVSVEYLVRLFLLVVAVPLLLLAFRKAQVRPITQSAGILRFSNLSIFVGTCIGAAATKTGEFTASQAIFGLGGCLEPTMRSLVAVTALDSGRSSALTAVEVLAMLGAAVGGPVVAATFSLGISWGGGWIGLPLYIGAGFLLATSLVLLAMRFHDERRAEGVEEESERLL
ncbi:hypothetical protein MY11210_005008 [Beauveria gryllotalpidicola]